MTDREEATIAPQPLTDKEMDAVSAGADYTATPQLLSNILRLLEDTNKAIIGNIR
jgi:hypothetical protein